MSRQNVTGPDSTTGCPLGWLCEACGAVRDLQVALVDLPAGTTCMTLCHRCATSDIPPQMTTATAARLVGQHHTHRQRTTGRETP